MRCVVVEEVLSEGPFGGAIFRSTCEAGEKQRIVACNRVMPRIPVKGEAWLIEGNIRRHPQHGLQVEATRAVLSRPSGRLIINAIARSPAFPGIGEALARRVWERHREATYPLLAAGDPTPFVEDLGPDLAGVLVRGWFAFTADADAYVWLDRHGVSVGLATKLLALYGEKVAAKLDENPYRLLAFTNWKTADRLARSLGVAPEDPRRLVAAADAAVYHRLEFKHTWASRQQMSVQVRRLLGGAPQTALKALHLAVAEQGLVAVGDGLQGIGPWSMERYIAARIKAMRAGEFVAAQATLRAVPDRTFLQDFFTDYARGNGLALNAEQRDAIRMALTRPVGIIAGGAGVGKTTVLHALCRATERLGGQIRLMALSGRAARRMTEATNRPALTIAAFLQQVDRGEIDLDGEPTIAVDEASMLDLPTMYRLLRRLEPGCRLLLIGDPGQLPPISFGVVFHALVDTGAVPLVELRQIHRQAAATGIPQASKAIREGWVPELRPYLGTGAGLSFIDCRLEEIPEILVEVVEDLGGFAEAQILSPVKNGPAGTRAVNHLFHNRLAASPVAFAPGEPVIWLKNDYDLGLMNGSLGTVLGTEGGLSVRWDEGVRTIEDLRRLEHAYGITIHKSQGSQCRRVVIPVFGCRLLDRAMLYTAITRAKEQVVLVGDRSAFERAIVEPPRTSLRQTAMHFHLAA